MFSHGHLLLRHDWRWDWRVWGSSSPLWGESSVERTQEEGDGCLGILVRFLLRVFPESLFFSSDEVPKVTVVTSQDTASSSLALNQDRD